MRILVAPDSFKGTLDARRAAEAMAEGVAAFEPSADVDVAPLSDGGRGFAERLLEALGGEWEAVDGIEDPLGRPITASIAWLDDGSAAFDAAAACGLHLVEPSPRSAVAATTRGVGQLLMKVLRDDRPITRVYVGVGDTASTDGGVGAASLAGWGFVDERGHHLDPGGGSLWQLHRISRPPEPIAGAIQVVAACDVASVLHGEEGAARRFAPQKGAGPEEVDILEAGLLRFDERTRLEIGVAVGRIAGGGAGGGLGAGLVGYYGAATRAGFDVVADAVELEERLSRADLVLTGEGSFDPSSLSGKVTGEVIRRARIAGVPSAVVAGRLEVPPDLLIERGVEGGLLSGDDEPGLAIVRATTLLLERLMG